MQIERLPAHAPAWTAIYQLLEKQRMPHALLFTGPRHAGILQFVNRLMSILVCQNPESAPCGYCQPCHLLLQGTHPDIRYVRQDTPASPIKIEQIRALQESVYQTPQCGTRSIIVIEQADRLNQSAANALLKILEEPPAHILFILIAEQIGSLPATIISRCQQYHFSSPESFSSVEQVDYLTIGNFYPEASERAELFKQCLPILDGLCELIDQTTSPSALASRWSNYALGDLLWFLYLFTAQAIRQQLLDCRTSQPWADKLHYFSERADTADLFLQLDKINSLMGIVQQNITLNQTLAIETLLMDYTRRQP